MTIRAYDHFMHTGGDYPGAGRIMENFHGIIKQCLVYGSGGVPAAGWNLEYDEGEPSGTFVLSNGDRDFFICFFERSTQRIQVSIAATFEGIDANGFIVGEAARSGRDPGVTSPEEYNSFRFMGYGTGENARGGWSMLADANTCSFVLSGCDGSISPGPGMDTGGSSLRRYGGGFSFGKTTKGFGYVSGTGTSGYYYHPAENITTINDPRTGFLIPSFETIPPTEAGVRGLYNGTASNTAPFVYEDQMILPMEAYMQGSETVGPGSLGRIRGFIQMPFVDKSLYPRHLLNALGMAEDDFETMRIQDLSKFRVGSDGYRYAYGKLANGDTTQAQIFLTDNPMVW